MTLDEGSIHTVKLGNDLRLSGKVIGDVRLEVDGITQVFTKVYYVPKITSSLLRIGQLQEKNVDVIIKQGVCRIYHPQRGFIITSTMSRNQMFIVNTNMKIDNHRCYKTEVEGIQQLCHKRPGHINRKSLRIMPYKQMVETIPHTSEASKSCEVCNLL